MFVQKLKSVLPRQSKADFPGIFISKNQEIHGPFTPMELKTKILSTEYNKNDLGWYEGLSEWIRLSDLMNSFPGNPFGSPIIRKKLSGFARTSYYLGIVGIILWLVIFFPTMAIFNSEGSSTSTVTLTVGAFIYGYMGANFFGVIFACMALTNRYSNKSMAMYGLIFNLVSILLSLVTLR